MTWRRFPCGSGVRRRERRVERRTRAHHGVATRQNHGAYGSVPGEQSEMSRLLRVGRAERRASEQSADHAANDRCRLLPQPHSFLQKVVWIGRGWLSVWLTSQLRWLLLDDPFEVATDRSGSRALSDR